MTDTFNIQIAESIKTSYNNLQQHTIWQLTLASRDVLVAGSCNFSQGRRNGLNWWLGICFNCESKKHWHLSHLNLIIGFAPLACTRHVAQEFQGQTCFKRKTQAFRNFLWCNMICEISTGSTGCCYSSTGCSALSPFHKLGLILKRGSLMVIRVLSV